MRHLRELRGTGREVPTPLPGRLARGSGGCSGTPAGTPTSGCRGQRGPSEERWADERTWSVSPPWWTRAGTVSGCSPGSRLGGPPVHHALKRPPDDHSLSRQEDPSPRPVGRAGDPRTRSRRPVEPSCRRRYRARARRSRSAADRPRARRVGPVAPPPRGPRRRSEAPGGSGNRRSWSSRVGRSTPAPQRAGDRTGGLGRRTGALFVGEWRAPHGREDGTRP